MDKQPKTKPAGSSRWKVIPWLTGMRAASEDDSEHDLDEQVRAQLQADQDLHGAQTGGDAGGSHATGVPQQFDNRLQAGRLLARRLMAYVDKPGVAVLAIPRGGVPVGLMVAQALHAPLDVVLVRKLGLPGHPEFAVGAVGEGGLCTLQTSLLASLHVPREMLDEVAQHQQREIARQQALYRGALPSLALPGKTVIVVDDGLATGATMSMAIEVLRQSDPARIVVAVPVAPSQVCRALAQKADEVICLASPEPFGAIGEWYRDFHAVDDKVAQRLLRMARIADYLPP
jgi:putative phosphoribosyl transferase